MGPLVESTQLSKSLIDAGNNLLNLHSSTDAILSLLDEIESLLCTVEQDPTLPIQHALVPSMKALVSAHLLRNPDSDVRVSVISCLTEIMRITAPEAPYNDDQMKEIFQVTIEAFGRLADTSSRSYRKAEVVLETVSKVRSSLVMLDLECDDLILEMFRQFLKIIRPDHPEGVLLAMETIMITVIDESEEVSMDLLEILLTAVRKESQDVSPMALGLVEKVLSSCAPKLQPFIMEALKSTGTSFDMYSPVVSSIFPSESATTQAHSVVNAKENEADEKILEKQIVPSDSLEVQHLEKLDLGHSCKGNRSKRTARAGTREANGDDQIRTGNDYQKLLKQGQSESTDAETESESTRKRGRKPNSLMNPEEGYLFKTSSSKRVQEKELGDSSLGKLAAKKTSSPTKVGQTNQSLVISLSTSSRARTGSRKRSRDKMEETNHDVGSFVTTTSKKQMVKKDNPEEEDLMEFKLEKPEDGIKAAKSSKKERATNDLAKTTAKKQMVKKDNPEEEDLMESKHEKPEDGIKAAKSSKKERATNDLAKTTAKKQIVKKDNSEEEDLMESKHEKPADGIKAAKSSKKERPENGLVKTSAKKQIAKKDNSEEEDLMESKHEKPADGIKAAKSSKKERPENGLAKTSAKKQLVKKDNSEEEDLMESKHEKPEDDVKTAKSTKNERGLAKSSSKKPLAETKTVKTSGKKLVNSDAKKKNSEGASTDTPILQSSKSKKKNSHATTPSTKKSEQTPKSHPKKKRTAVEEVESNTNELGEEMIGKRVNVWWPLDKKFYEGVIDSYCSRTKMHRVLYSDGDAEELNLKKERFEIIQDNSPVSEDKEIDLAECIPLSAFIKRQKAKKSKNVSKNVETSSSPEARSPMGTVKNKDPATDLTKQAKRTKGAVKVVSNEAESSEGKNLKPSEKLNGEPDRTKGRTGKKQKVTQASHKESEKGFDEKETKGEDSLKFGKESNAEPEHQEVPENQNAETKTGGEEQKSAKEPNAEPETDGKERNSVDEPNAEPKTDGEEQEAAKEAIAEPKTDEKEQEAAKESTAEPKTDEEEQKSLEETNVEPKTEGDDQKSVNEPNAEPKTEVEEKESAKEQTADTKSIGNEGMPEAKGEEIDKETYTRMSETGKVENKADLRVIEELKEESDKAEVGTRPGSG